MEDRFRNENDTQVPTVKQKGKIRKLLFVGLLVLLVLGGAYWQGGGLPFVTSDQGGDTTPGAFPRYSIPMKEFQVNLADQGARRFLRMRIYLAFDERALLKEIEERGPEIRSNIITILRSKTVADLDGPEGMEALRLVILDRLNELLQGGRITSLYFDELIIQ